MSVPSNLVSKLNPQIYVDQSIYEPNTTQQAPLGTRLCVGDRTFYYAQASASVGGGTVLSAPITVASNQSGLLSLAATSAGAKVVTATASALVAASLYAEGYLGEAVGAGIGEMYRIKNHPAGSTGFAITLYDGLATTITSGVGYWLMKNNFANVWVGSQNLDVAVGVAPTAVTSGGYFWMQTWGLANPTHVAATPAGGALVLGTTGSVVVTADVTTGGGLATVAVTIGKNSRLAATAGQANPVFLMIMP